MPDLPDIASRPDVVDLVKRAIEEDIGSGDATTQTLVDPEAEVRAVVLAREHTVVSGTAIAALCFTTVDARLACEILITDGLRASAGEAVMTVHGPAASVLSAERTALNFMQRMSGIARLTREFVDRVSPYRVTVLDTRKTTPCLRVLEKYAVLCGGGKNHRQGLYDRVLIKDNHRRLWRHGDETRLDLAVAQARKRCAGLWVEVEVETKDELLSALAGRPDWILLDNMDVEALKEAVRLCKGKTRLEASGGITLDTVEAIARTGVDAVSLGCLTHSAPAADLSLELEHHE